MSIELVINGYAIALPKGLKLNREMETTIFNKTDTVYDFSYPVEIPLTESTRFALGFPDELAISGRTKKYQGTLNINGLFVGVVDVEVLGVSLKAKTCRLSVFGKYSALATVFGEKKVNEVLIGYDVTYGDGYTMLDRTETGFDELNWTLGYLEPVPGAGLFGQFKVKYQGHRINAHITAISKGLVDSDFLFPKAVDLNTTVLDGDSAISIINAYDDARDRHVDADVYNFINFDWKYNITRTSFGYPYVLDNNAHQNDQRHFWVPMFKLQKVLVECFAQSGLTLVGDFITDTKLANTVLYNTAAINRGIEVQYTTGGDTQIHLNRNEWYAVYSPNHLPQMRIIDFIQELCKRYNLQFNYDSIKKEVSIVRVNEFIFSPSNILDLTSVANPKPNIVYENSDEFLNGYKLSFASDASDGASGDAVESIEGLTYRGAVDTAFLLSTIATPLNNEIAYVRNVNAYYKYVVDFLAGNEWVFYSHNLDTFKSSPTAQYEIETKILTMPMQVVPVNMVAMDSVMGTPAWTDPGSTIGASAFFGAPYVNEWEAVPISNIGITFDFFNIVDWAFTDWAFFWPNPWVRHRNQLRRKPIDHLPKLINCVGLTPGYDDGIWTANYFMGTSTSYNCSGGVEPLYSGAWGNSDNLGLYFEWWKRFLEAIKDSYVIEQEVLFSIAQYISFDPNNTMVVINGLKYYPKKANFVMPFPELATLYLVRV